MEHYESICPLLEDPGKYIPDTIDLINNSHERAYWLKCLQDMVFKFIKKAGILNPNYPQATEVAEKCFEEFSKLVRQANLNTSVLNPLSIRTLLEFNEQTLRENNFNDAWLNQKERETQSAFQELPDRIEYIDNILDSNVKWLEIAKGVLAGNMFDWGARAVTDILEMSKEFGLKQAMDTIQDRPWFRDCLDQWVSQVEKSPHKMAVIFVDNAGVDFVLGILPFVRQLLKGKTKVILSANSRPALNDITHNELIQCLYKASEICQIIKDSIANGQLVAVENGQGGPCLDLSHLNEDLCESMQSADLIVLEGMGRAVHTNFNAKFKVDSLKLAVIKNEWLAKSLGAEQFSVIFEYIPAS